MSTDIYSVEATVTCSNCGGEYVVTMHSLVADDGPFFWNCAPCGLTHRAG